MAQIKLTQMSLATTMNAADYFMIVQGGVNKKSDLSNILSNLNSGNAIRVNPLQNAINFSVASKNNGNMFVVSGAADRIGIGTDNPQSVFHVIGNSQIGSGSVDGVLVQSAEEITYTSADQTNIVTKSISPSRAITSLICNTGCNGLFSLGAGFNGQLKTIAQQSLDTGAAKTSTITVAGGMGFNTITFNAVGDSAVIQYASSSSKWIIIGGNGADYSTV